MFMAPIDKKAKTDITHKITASIQRVLDSPELDKLSEEQIEKIAKSYYFDKLRKDFDREVKKAKLDRQAVEDLVAQWLSGFQSKHTVRSFKKNLEYFLTWLNGTSIIDVDSLVVDKFISFLNSNKQLSGNTKRQRIASPSSFYSDLTRWGIVSMNPFKGAKGLPKKKIAIKIAEQIPTDEELELIENYAIQQIEKAQQRSGRGDANKITGNINALCAIKILRKEGLRVGVLKTITVDRDGNYYGKSKGKDVTGHFDNDILDLLSSYGLIGKEPFKDYSENAFSMWLWRVQSTEELSGKITHKYSPHGIRHRFAINYYNRTHDVYGLMIKLGHSSLLVTTAYLAGLKIFLA